MEFMRSFQSEAPLKRGVVSAQDASLQERVLAQVDAAVLKGSQETGQLLTGDSGLEMYVSLHLNRESRIQ